MKTRKTELLYGSDKGVVYALPLDGMKCLVPKIHSDMPVATYGGLGYIPNSLLRPGQKPIHIIPLKQPSVPSSKIYIFPNPKPQKDESDKLK